MAGWGPGPGGPNFGPRGMGGPMRPGFRPQGYGGWGPGPYGPGPQVCVICKQLSNFISHLSSGFFWTCSSQCRILKMPKSWVFSGVVEFFPWVLRVFFVEFYVSLSLKFLFIFDFVTTVAKLLGSTRIMVSKGTWHKTSTQNLRVFLTFLSTRYPNYFRKSSTYS